MRGGVGRGDGVTISPAGNIKAAAPVDAGATYAVRVRGACEDGASVVILVLWKDGNGITIGRDRERVTPPRRGQTFILTTAVEDAASAVIHFAPWEGACTITSGTMRELINAP